MKAYKGFDRNMQCRGFQFREGETYEEPKAELCNAGFHACRMPIDVFRYYPPTDGAVYHEVELDGVDTATKNCGDDSKICGRKITIGRELTLEDMIDAQIAAVAASGGYESAYITGEERAAQDSRRKGVAQASGNHGAAQVSGYQGAAQASGDACSAQASGMLSAAQASGYSGAAQASGGCGVAQASGDHGAALASGFHGFAQASGYQGAAQASGDHGAAQASGCRGAAQVTGYQGAAQASGCRGAAQVTGYQGAAQASGCRGAAQVTGYQGAAQAIGEHSVATAAGMDCLVSGELGCALFAVERDVADGKIISVAAGIVDGNTLKPGTWYCCKGGKLVEAER